MKIGLIGHSHAICLMDAMGPWRDQMGIAPAARTAKPGYAAAFDGWDAVKAPSAIYLPSRKVGGIVADLVAVIAFGGIRGYDLVAAEVAGDTGEIILNPSPTLTVAAAAFQGCDAIVSIIFGNELAKTIWLDDLPAYDFIEVSVPGPLRKDAQLIDRRYIEQVLDGHLSRTLRTCAWLGRSCRQARIVHVMSPPPLEDLSGLRHLEALGGAIRESGVLDATLRLKWYRAYVRRTMATLHPASIAVIPPPMAAHSKEGYLRKDLAAGLTHGNALYGALVWDSVAATLGACP